jgi:cysteinyl-tRNA synthetase
VLARQLTSLAAVIGLLGRSPQQFLQAGASAAGLAEADIETMIAARTAAKVAKNFAEADRIRQDLLAQGVVLEDKAGALTEWRRA